MLTYFFLVVAILLQTIPIILAIRLIRTAQSRMTWILISIGFSVMAFRRLIELFIMLKNPDLSATEWYTSLIDITISVLIIASLIYLNRILKSIRAADNERYESEIRFRTLFNNSSDELFLADLDGNFLEVNKEVCNRLGYKREELLKMNFADIKTPRYVNQVRENIEMIIQNGTHIYESEHLTKEKKILSLEMSSRIIRYKAQKIIFTIARDITERKEFERKVLSAVIEAEERERKRFAKELHDGLGPLLSTVKIYLNEIYSEDIEPDEKSNLIKYTNELLDDAVSNIRTISDNLMPTVITDHGLIKAIESFAKKINLAGKIHFTFSHTGFTSKLDINLEMVLYRITEELINNTLKHAGAVNAAASIEVNGKKLVLNYSDDGVGCIVNELLLNSREGMGIKNIISRSKTINGAYTFGNTLPGFKFRLEVYLK
ncbi:MAG: PAS domain S-box protein [Bacteroidota bacterium]